MSKRNRSKRDLGTIRTQTMTLPYPCEPLFERPPFVIYEKVLTNYGSSVRTYKNSRVKKMIDDFASSLKNMMRNRDHE